MNKNAIKKTKNSKKGYLVSLTSKIKQRFLVAWSLFLATALGNINVVAASGGGFTIQSALGEISKIVIIGGSVWIAIGLVIVGIGLKDKTGPEIQKGIWQIIGGGLVVVAGGIIASIS